MNNSEIIAHYIAQGAVGHREGRIGLELEHIIVRKGSDAPVTYYEAGGIRETLEELSPFYEERIYGDDNQLIGLIGKDDVITIEPAGQLEISIAPQACLSRIEDIYCEFRKHLDGILEHFGSYALELGYHPTARAHELPLIPKERYRLMDAHFAHTGAHGISMMRGSASTQVSIDYLDEADALRKFRIANILGPLIAFVCDNTPIFEASPSCGRMARTRMWGDVDPARSMVAPHLFESDFNFARYANTLLDAPPILLMRNGITVPVSTQSTRETLDTNTMDEAQVEHLLSMFFFDVRLKHYIEIRMADSLPIEYALAYAAFIKGIFYREDNLVAIEALLPMDTSGCFALNDGSIPQSKRAIEQDGYAATIYGTPAWKWLDRLITLAWRGLPLQEQPYLAPLAHLVQRRTTLFDEAFAARSSVAFAPMPILETEYRSIIDSLDGDVAGRKRAYEYLQHSTAIYHDEVVVAGYLPKLLPDPLAHALERTAFITHRILCKVTDHYREDASYRALFGFDPRLEELICLEQGYEQRIPICRIDLFLDEEAQFGEPGSPGELCFGFCEFNTDGTSAMNEDREVAAALSLTPSFAHLSERYTLVPQELFDPWVRACMTLYEEYAATHPRAAEASDELFAATPLSEAMPCELEKIAPENSEQSDMSTFSPKTATFQPHVAIVDFTENATSYEFVEFQKRFVEHGVRCSIFDARELAYDGRTLSGPDGQRIDCVYRRAVTMDIMAHYDEVRPLLDAIRDGSVCCIGGFMTQIAHSKKVFEVLHSPATQAFLTPEERAFVQAHVPATMPLDEHTAEVIHERNRWIIKPADGYASQGVYAGRDMNDEQWQKIVAQCAGQGYLAQEFCAQHASLQTPLHEPSASTTQQVDAFEPYNNLLGLYVYNGRFAGIYTRQGQRGIIHGAHGGITAACFLAKEKL